MKKILVISRELYPYTYGGMAHHMYEVLKRVKKYEFIVLTTFDERRKNEENIKFIQTKCPKINFLFIFSSMLHVINKEFDVIFGNALIGSVTALLIKIIKRKKMVAFIGDIDIILEKKVGLMKRLSRKIIFFFLFKFADRILVLSNKVKNDIIKFYNVSLEKIEITTSGVEHVDEDELKKIEEEGWVISVCGIKPNKGLEFAIEAMKSVVQHFPNLKYYIVGSIVDKNYFNYLRKILLEYGLEKNVFFTGRVKNVKEYYGKCAVLLLASYHSEGFGLPVIEAGMMGKPVVATKIFEDIGVVKNNINGMVVEQKNSKELGNALIKLLKDRELRNKMGKKGREFALKYTWENAAQCFMNTIEKVV
ncbi:MAG: glycosyltransferase family 4 protein [Candidatus Thermoplasmatota archaeon]